MLRRLLAALLLVAASCSGAEELHVFAAASLTNALQEIARGYEARSGEKIVFNFGGSSTLARQIEHGAPADLFLSADEEKMDALSRRGRIDRSSRRSILSNTLVIVVPLGSSAAIGSAADLRRFASIALADPQSVPAGVYARLWLTRKSLWNDVASRVIPTDNVRAALAAVEAGNADAAIVYRTDAMLSRDVRVAFEIPRAETPEISYPFAVVAGTTRRAAAERFLLHLQSPAARAIFEKHGFLVRAGGPA